MARCFLDTVLFGLIPLTARGRLNPSAYITWYDGVLIISTSSVRSFALS